jgi:hypothetical protein
MHGFTPPVKFSDNPVRGPIIGAGENQNHDQISIGLALNLSHVFMVFFIAVNNNLGILRLSVDGVGLGVLATLR